MFEHIFQCLTESSQQRKPAFIFGFSTSNHTPFEHPDSYKPYPLQIPDSVIKVLRTNKEIAVKNFTNYQYANDCLGKFIERVRNSRFGKNTIIVATGDHNTLQLFDFSDKQLLQKLSVPLVLYVPEQYRKNPSPDIRLFASHKDIFPTIFNLSLSHERYSGLGNNLFDNSKSRNDFFALNEFKTVLNDYGAVIIGNPPLYYKWETQEKKLLIPINTDETPQLKILPERVRFYTAAATLAIQNEIWEKKN